MKSKREVHNRERYRASARGQRTRLIKDTDSVAARLARPPGRTDKKRLRRKRKEAARKESLRPKEGDAAANVSCLNDLNDSASRGIYETLLTDEIRVLVLQPGLRHQLLECRLEHSKLGDPISSKYKALSYVWGSAVVSKTITLCSHTFHVTHNLFEALLELRQQDTEYVLWIDALCINQCDVMERNRQIPMMSRIYERAKEVIAWLGPVTRDLESALELLGTASTSEAVLLALLQQNTRKAVEWLMSRKYWYRAWIVQEIAFARLVRIQCSKCSISFETLEQILESMPRVTSGICVPGESTGSVNSPIAFPKKLLGPRSASSETSDSVPPTLFLDSLLDRECGDPRDSVFAFYNLFPETLQKCITLDYKLHQRDVLLQAVSAIIKTTQSLSAITIKSRQKDPIGNARTWQQAMPSWCPYVSTSFETDSLAAWQSPLVLDIVNTEISVDLSKRHVHTHGYTIGTISETIPCGGGLVCGDRESFNGRELECILYQVSSWKDYGITIPEPNEKSKAFQATMHISPSSRLESGSTDIRDENETRSESGSTDVRDEHEAIRYYRAMRKRRVCKVKIANSGGRLATGVVPVTARKKDKICWLIGSPSALVLRMLKPKGNQEQFYEVVGEAYIEDVYELPKMAKRERFVLQ